MAVPPSSCSRRETPRTAPIRGQPRGSLRRQPGSSALWQDRPPSINRGGDGAANSALHIIAICRLLANGITMERVAEEDGFSIGLRGRAVDVELTDRMLEIWHLLAPI